MSLQDNRTAQTQTITCTLVTANTASLARGAGVIEWYRSRREGVEQGFTCLTLLWSVGGPPGAAPASTSTPIP